MPPVPSGPWFNEIAKFLGKTYSGAWYRPGNGVHEGNGARGRVPRRPCRAGSGSGCSTSDAARGATRFVLARGGIDVVGVDLSEDFITLARDEAEADVLPARFEVGDVRELAYDGEFDAVFCLCQGGFGLLGGRDEPRAFERIAAALRPGGRLALTAFSAAFAVRFLEAGESFDPATGVLHERSTVRNEDGEEKPFDPGRRASRRASSSCSPGARGSRSSACTASHPDGTEPRGRRSTTPNCCSWLGGTPDRGLPW